MSRLWLGSLVAVLVGCAEEPLSQETVWDTTATAATTDSPLCQSAPETLVPGDEPIDAFDSDPGDLFASATGNFVGELDVGDPVPLTLDIDPSLSEYRYTARAWDGPEQSPEAASCQPTLEASFAALIDTDGVLDLSFSATFVATPGALGFDSPIPTDHLAGSLAPANPSVTDLQLSATLDPDLQRWSGSLLWSGPSTSDYAIAGEFWGVRYPIGE